MSTTNKLWTTKYKPVEIDDMALSEENRNLLKEYINQGEIPNLLLAGRPGIGKTTLANILASKLDARVKMLNASMDRGIDIVRNEIYNFAKSRMLARWNILLLDEADFMTKEAQESMRNLTDSYSEQTRIIMTANYPHRISSALKSRCHEIKLSDITPKERARILVRILKKENIDIDKHAVISYAKKYTDLRKMLGAAQTSVLSNGGVLKSAHESSFDVTGTELWEIISQKKWDALVNISKKETTDHLELLKTLFWAIPNEPSLKAAQLRSIVEEQITNSGFAPDPVVHFLGTCSKVIKEL